MSDKTYRKCNYCDNEGKKDDGSACNVCDHVGFYEVVIKDLTAAELRVGLEYKTLETRLASADKVIEMFRLYKTERETKHTVSHPPAYYHVINALTEYDLTEYDKGSASTETISAGETPAIAICHARLIEAKGDE